MSIFSLQTKKHLVGWSVVLGSVLSWPSSLIRYHSTCSFFNDAGPVVNNANCVVHGFPLAYKPHFALGEITTVDTYTGWYNLLFWILVSLILLSLIRYFKYRTNYK